MSNILYQNENSHHLIKLTTLASEPFEVFQQFSKETMTGGALSKKDVITIVHATECLYRINVHKSQT